MAEMREVLYGAPFIRTGFNYDRMVVSDSTGLKCEDPSMTQQQFAEECDINTIVERFGLTGELPTDVRMPLEADFVEAIDFKSAMDAIVSAEAAFMQMPAKVRARFGNDPHQFVEFINDDSNRAEAERLGLVRPRATLQGVVVPDKPDGSGKATPVPDAP